MTMFEFVRSRADWIALIEAIHGTAASDTDWGEAIVQAARPLFPNAAHMVTYALAYDAAFEISSTPVTAPRTMAPMFPQMREVAAGQGVDSWRPFHFSRPVVLQRDILRAMKQPVASAVAQHSNAFGFCDGIGVIAHPRPGLVTVIGALFDRPVALSRWERENLGRIAMHLEAGHRLRLNPRAVVGEVDHRGRVDVREGALSTRQVGAHVTRIGDARKRTNRRNPASIDWWTSLLAGKISVVPQAGRYLLLENPPSSQQLRALPPEEVAVLALAARGMPTKAIAYALGVSSPLVSRRLRSATVKIGAVSHTDLVRLAALLTQNPQGLLEDEALTAAEHEVLALLERGLRNDQIAAARMRSARTIANQVASILRKTGSSSRRQLIGRPTRRG